MKEVQTPKSQIIKSLGHTNITDIGINPPLFLMQKPLCIQITKLENHSDCIIMLQLKEESLYSYVSNEDY